MLKIKSPKGLWSVFVLCFSINTTGACEPSELRFASWNIRNINNSRTDAELTATARVLADYDFIALMEVRDETVLMRTQAILAQMGKTYLYEFSPAVGRTPTAKEHYAFFYKPEFISVVRSGELYPDTADGSDDFARDPYWATFRAGEFDFSVIVVHVVWGETVSGRQAEIMELASVYDYVQDANGAEEDVLLVGDFNRNPDDLVAYGPLLAKPSMIQLFSLPEKSHIRDSSLYDNILFQKNAVTEYTGTSGIDRFDETDFANDDAAANLAVSDHRPVWAVFDLTYDDDGSDRVGYTDVVVKTVDRLRKTFLFSRVKKEAVFGKKSHGSRATIAETKRK